MLRVYRDSLESVQSNCLESYHSAKYVSASLNDFRRLGFKLESVDRFDGVGLYIIDLAHNPAWWSGLSNNPDVSKIHVLKNISDKVLSLCRDKKLRIVLDCHEGGPVIKKDSFDCFKELTIKMSELRLPAGSVILLAGNAILEEQYNKWLSENSFNKLFDVMYSSPLLNFYFADKSIRRPLILDALKDDASKNFNSLNRSYRPHRGAHLYRCLKDDLLDQGLVSGNVIKYSDKDTEKLLGEGYGDLIDHFPKYLDGDWTTDNPADKLNTSIFKQSLLTVVTESQFINESVNLSEKIFRPMYAGHPLIVFGAKGYLKSLKKMGFAVTFCNIDPSYNEVTDPKNRFDETQKILYDWCNLSKGKKIKLIINSMDSIIHNYNYIRSKNFYRQKIMELVKRSEKYFMEVV